MSVMAAEEAPAAAAAIAPGAEGHSKGVLLAIAIILLWLACFAFFIAFEGSKLLGEQADTTGGGLLKAMISGLATKAAQAEG